MAEQTILIAEDDPDIRDGVLDDVTNLISIAARRYCVYQGKGQAPARAENLTLCAMA